MAWTVAKIAVAGALTALPVAAVSVPAVAVASSGSVTVVLPADPPVDPTPVPHGEYYNPNDANDWWSVGDTGGGGGGG